MVNAYTTGKKGDFAIMGWSPQLNFRLRDDQVAFGDLILDKNGAQFISEMLIEIKKGAVPDLGLMKTVLDDYCFTNEEFSNLKNEMVEIQEDIKEFKQIGSNTLQKYNVFIKTLAVNTNYIVGSDTWIERYKELKMIAADMFNGIIKCGYKFEESRLRKLHERYDEIIGCTDGMERVGNVFQRQYKEALLNGDEHALDNYCACMVEAGVWSPEVAERERRRHEVNNLLNIAEGSKKYADSLRAKQTSRSAITVTWDMYKTMCERYDDADPNSVSIEDLQKAEKIIDTMVEVFAQEGNMSIEEMESAHKSDKLISVAIAVVNNTKYCIEKEDYELIMNFKTRSEVIRESNVNASANSSKDTITLTQAELMKAVKAFEALLNDTNRRKHRGVCRMLLREMFLYVNDKTDIASMAKNYTASDDFVDQMKALVTQPSVGPMIDSEEVQFPTEKINKFYEYCNSIDTSDDSNIDSGSIIKSVEQEMLIRQTSGNIDTDMVKAVSQDSQQAHNVTDVKDSSIEVHGEVAQQAEDNSDDTITISQIDISRIGLTDKTVLTDDLKNDLIELILAYGNGLRNWAPGSAWSEISGRLHLMEMSKRKAADIYVLNDIIGTLSRLSNIRGIDAINVNVNKSLYNRVVSACNEKYNPNNIASMELPEITSGNGTSGNEKPMNRL